MRAEYKRLYGVSTEAILKVPAGTPTAQAKAQHGQSLAEVETRIVRIRAAAKGEEIGHFPAFFPPEKSHRRSD
jgi:hypothetical protein